ncbi:MAG: hypothetical protein KDA88_14165 [Planctomycetaceae bacterium]|nr:hypothetical protein [Planctomycetaceae bacterium]MCB9951992.1 hypothetical protein [Planctomycetaceae bacterium]
MLIKYKFCTRDGTSVTGEFAATESAFYGIESGDEIPVRYISDHPQINAPDDALSIIKAVPKPSEA